MKINDIPLLDCYNKENSKFLIEKFNNMSMIKNKNLSYKNFKNDIDRLSDLAFKICSKTNFKLTAISYFKNRQTAHLIKKDSLKLKNKEEKKDIFTFSSKNLNEMYLKICVFCYYKMKKEKVHKNEK